MFKLADKFEECVLRTGKKEKETENQDL